MNKIIDLSVFENETLDIKLPNSEKIIRITKPVQRMVIEILKFKNLSDNSPATKIVDTLNRIIWQILNSNDEGYKITQEYVQNDLNMQMKLAIIHSYGNFITGIQNQKNS